jgi:hypothetical protein
VNKAVPLYTHNHILTDEGFEFQEIVDHAVLPIVEKALVENVDVSHLKDLVISCLDMQMIFGVAKRAQAEQEQAS